MALNAGFFRRYADPTPRLILVLTAVICFLEGVATAYQVHLQEVLAQTLSLSGLEWMALLFGSFLAVPLLLFGLLYGVRARRQRTLTVSALLPGLIIAVIAGSLSGQYLGVTFLSVSGSALPVMVLGSPRLTILSPYGVQGWLILIEPLVIDLLIAVAALALAELRHPSA